MKGLNRKKKKEKDENGQEHKKEKSERQESEKHFKSLLKRKEKKPDFEAIRKTRLEEKEREERIAAHDRKTGFVQRNDIFIPVGVHAQLELAGMRYVIAKGIRKMPDGRVRIALENFEGDRKESLALKTEEIQLELKKSDRLTEIYDDYREARFDAGCDFIAIRDAVRYRPEKGGTIDRAVKFAMARYITEAVSFAVFSAVFTLMPLFRSVDLLFRIICMTAGYSITAYSAMRIIQAARYMSGRKKEDEKKDRLEKALAGVQGRDSASA